MVQIQQRTIHLHMTLSCTERDGETMFEICPLCPPLKANGLFLTSDDMIALPAIATFMIDVAVSMSCSVAVNPGSVAPQRAPAAGTLFGGGASVARSPAFAAAGRGANAGRKQTDPVQDPVARDALKLLFSKEGNYVQVTQCVRMGPLAFLYGARTGGLLAKKARWHSCHRNPCRTPAGDPHCECHLV